MSCLRTPRQRIEPHVCCVPLENWSSETMLRIDGRTTRKGENYRALVSNKYDFALTMNCLIGKKDSVDLLIPKPDFAIGKSNKKEGVKENCKQIINKNK